MIINNIFTSLKHFGAFRTWDKGPQFWSDCSCKELIYFQQNEVTENNQFNVAQVSMYSQVSSLIQGFSSLKIWDQGPGILLIFIVSSKRKSTVSIFVPN